MEHAIKAISLKRNTQSYVPIQGKLKSVQILGMEEGVEWNII